MGVVKQEKENLTDKIVNKNKLLNQIIFELYKSKPSIAELVDEDIDNEDYIFIETTKNMKNLLEQNEVVEKTLLENLRLKQELQKLCHEMNNHYNYSDKE